VYELTNIIRHLTFTFNAQRCHGQWGETTSLLSGRGERAAADASAANAANAAAARAAARVAARADADGGARAEQMFGAMRMASASASVTATTSDTNTPSTSSLASSSSASSSEAPLQAALDDAAAVGALWTNEIDAQQAAIRRRMVSLAGETATAARKFCFFQL
jgi:hypothetical protein